MAIKLNSKGKSHANSLVASGKIDRDSSWSFSPEDENKLLGDPPDWKEYGKWFLGVDDSADEETKAHYKYPYGKNGKVYRAGVIAAKQRASAQNESDIADAADGLLKKIDKNEEAKSQYWTIRAQTASETSGEAESAEVLLYGEIGEGLFTDGVGAKKFAEAIKGLGKVKNLEIRINSPGGSVFEGLAIYNTLDRHPAKKTVYVDGLAASIASVIAMAGNTVVMPENAIMMVHDPFGMVVGNAEDMRKMADALDKIKEGLISAYMKKTKMSRQDIADLMSDETWMVADEAIEWGFADEKIDAVKMAACASFDLSKFKRVPKNIFAKSRDEPPPAASIPNAAGSRVEPDKPITSTIKGGDQMEKCPICATALVNGVCPACEAKQREQVRVKDILSIGERYDFLRADAVKAVQEGTTVEEFRAFALDQMNKRLVPINPLDRSGSQTGPPKVFKSFGEQIIAVIRAGLPSGMGGAVDPRLHVLNATGLGTQIPSDGGFLVQTDFSTALLDRIARAAVLAPKCWHVPIGPDADGIEMPYIDETSRATGSRWGGVQVYRRGEADTVTAKRPKFGMFELRLEDLMGICYVTNRMLKDAASTGAIVSRAFEEEFSFRIDDELVNGTGVGQALGILKSPALVTVPKETGQPGSTIVVENIVKMYSRMPARNRARAEWYYNQEIEPQLFTMGITIGTGGSPIYMPPGGLSASPYGTLLGRPLIPIEQASALGTVGDLIFADLNEYCIIEKGGLESEQSIHVRFIYDEMTLRFIVRNNGAPLWKSALTPYKGSNSLSPYVALATRS